MTDWSETADAVADWMIGEGATGVALMGSYARGDQHRLSDLDIVGLGTGQAEFRETDGVIVSISWTDAGSVRTTFGLPEDLIFTVPGWRRAVPLRDPRGEVAECVAAAQTWQWTAELERAARVWLAREVTGYCEEVFGLVRSLEAGDEYATAVLRSVFALRCARLVAVRHGVLYESEKQLWELVAQRQGGAWRQAQEDSFGLRGQPLAVSARAALRLYTFVVDEALPDLTEAQRPVVSHALDEIDRFGS